MTVATDIITDERPTEQFHCKCGKPAWYWIVVDDEHHIASCSLHIGEDLNSSVGDPNLVLAVTSKIHRMR